MKAKFKGSLIGASKLEIFGNDDKKTKVVKLKVIEHARTDEFGKSVGKDQIHEIRVLNKAIDKLPMQIIEETQTRIVTIDPPTKAEFTVYVNSKQAISKTDDSELTFTELMLADLELLK